MNTQEEEDISEIICQYKQLRQIESLYHKIKKVSPHPLFSSLTIQELQDFLLHNNEYTHVLKDTQYSENVPTGIQKFSTRPPKKEN